MSDAAPHTVDATSPCVDPYLPRTAEVIERRTEAPGVATLRLRFTDGGAASYAFTPGQFNMLHGPDGGVPISIVAGNEHGYFEHCVRGVGNATREIAASRKGDLLGIRGPFGGGVWPKSEPGSRDVLVISGGIGCAAVASAVEQVLADGERLGRLSILQGVTRNADHLYAHRFERWASERDTLVLLASMEGGQDWPGHTGLVTDLIDRVPDLIPSQTTALACGPEVMVRPVVDKLLGLGVGRSSIHVSFERNMQCGIGHCTHCQLGRRLVCRDGPVFSWDEIESDLRTAP